MEVKNFQKTLATDAADGQKKHFGNDRSRRCSQFRVKII